MEPNSTEFQVHEKIPLRLFRKKPKKYFMLLTTGIPFFWKERKRFSMRFVNNWIGKSRIPLSRLLVMEV